MNNSKYSAMKYFGSAIAVGGTAMLGAGLLNEHSSVKKKAKKTAIKAIDTFSNIVSGVQNMLN